jgi:hypothetical protein
MDSTSDVIAMLLVGLVAMYPPGVPGGAYTVADGGPGGGGAPYPGGGA